MKTAAFGRQRKRREKLERLRPRRQARAFDLPRGLRPAAFTCRAAWTLTIGHYEENLPRRLAGCGPRRLMPHFHRPAV